MKAKISAGQELQICQHGKLSDNSLELLSLRNFFYKKKTNIVVKILVSDLNRFTVQHLIVGKGIRALHAGDIFLNYEFINRK